MVDYGIEILLIEDNPIEEKRFLYAFERYHIISKVHVVRDGARALEYIFCTGAYADHSFENPKLILLDLKLPVVDGLEVLRRIRANERTRMIPVVVLTSSSEERDVVEAYNMGANSYIVKPLDFEKFKEAVKQLGCHWLLLNCRPTRVNRASPETRSQLMSV